MLYLSAYLLIFLLFLLSRPSIHRFPLKNGIYLSHERTNFLNGFYIAFVFLSHLSSSIGVSKPEIYMMLLVSMGQCVVTLFFFHSGYGLMCSLQKKGKVYAKSILCKRLPLLLLHFSIAVCIYWGMQTLCFHEVYSSEQIILALLSWESLGNSNWFITMTLLSYLLMGIVFMFVSNLKRGAIIFTCAIVALLYVVAYCKESYYVDTLLCLPLGMFYCLYRVQLEEKLKELKIPVILFGGFCVIIAYTCKLSSSVLTSSPWLMPLANSYHMLYAAGIVLIMSCISFKKLNPFMVWCGGPALFYLYIFQRIPMIIAKHIDFAPSMRPVYMLTAAVSSLILAAAAMFLFKRLDAFLYSDTLPAHRADK